MTALLDLAIANPIVTGMWVGAFLWFLFWALRANRPRVPAGLPSWEEAWVLERQGEIGKGVAVKFRSGPEVYNGTLVSVDLDQIQLTSELGIALTFYATPDDVQFWGTYDPAAMREAAMQQQVQQAMTGILMGGGRDASRH